MNGSTRIELSDDALLAQLASLCLETSRLKAEIVTYLIEVEERRLHLRMACTSMFDFCTRRLKMSVNVAFHRITAARLVRRYPCLLPAIARGELHLSSLVLLKNHLSDTNAEELLAAIRGKSVRDVETLLAARFPRPDIPAAVTPLAVQPLLPSACRQEPLAPAETPASATTRAFVKPLSPARFAVQLTVSQDVRDKLGRAKDMMRHRNPEGDLAFIVDRALDALLANLDKELRGKTERPRRSRGVRRGNIPREARRVVFARDGERCTYEDADRNRCPARAFLELDHVAARALGGDGEASNLRVLCKAHNRWQAESVFGREHVERAIARRRSGGSCGNCGPLRGAVSPVADEPPGVDAAANLQRPGCEGTDDDERACALRGLAHLGFKPGEAARALDAVLARHGRNLAKDELPGVLREAIGLLT